MEPDETVAHDSPPADPDDWTDEQWIEWLKATDTDAGGAPRPATVAGRVVHSTGGQVLGLTMMGVARAIYGQRNDRPVIVREANSEPENDPFLVVHLDHDNPEQSFAILRPEVDPSA